MLWEVFLKKELGKEGGKVTVLLSLSSMHMRGIFSFVFLRQCCLFHNYLVLCDCGSSYKAVGYEELISVESGWWSINAVTLKSNK